MPLLRQIGSFGLVGVFATLAHIAIAWGLFEWADFGPVAANAFGAAGAFAISYLGNARLTFATDRATLSSAARYMGVTAVSFAMTTAALAFVEANGLPTFIYAVIVLFTVPPTTFLLAKLWAFQPA